MKDDLNFSEIYEKIEQAEGKNDSLLTLQNMIGAWLIENPDGDKPTFVQQLMSDGYSEKDIIEVLKSLKASG